MVSRKIRDNVPISVIVVTRNEAARIAACLEGLQAFDDVWVVDSESTDETCALARAYGVQVANFEWNGAYPKKRQWCLDHLPLKYDWVFFVDADEIVGEDLLREIAALDLSPNSAFAGYFVRGRYLWPQGDGVKTLRFGLSNNKLALFDRRKIEFPVVDDLGLEGMGEIEGHYQPVCKPGFDNAGIGQLRHCMIHAACESKALWFTRHERYAVWEAGMHARGAWPEDPVKLRAWLKRIFRAMPMRHIAAFLHCYILKFGFLDGAAGFDFARSRAWYYRRINAISKTNRGAGKGGGFASLAPEER